MTQDTQHKIRNAFCFVERNQSWPGAITRWILETKGVLNADYVYEMGCEYR